MYIGLEHTACLKPQSINPKPSSLHPSPLFVAFIVAGDASESACVEIIFAAR